MYQIIFYKIFQFNIKIIVYKKLLNVYVNLTIGVKCQFNIFFGQH